MTSVFFIELSISNKIRYVCDIVEKFYNQNLTVHIFTKDKQSAHLVDQQLWSWKPNSFVPHKQVSEEAQDADEPVLISSSGEWPQPAQALVLFDPLPADVFLDYDYVVDFAETYDQSKVAESRKRFRLVRDMDGLNLEYIQLGAFLNKTFTDST